MPPYPRPRAIEQYYVPNAQSPEEFVSIDEYIFCLLLTGLPAALTALKSVSGSASE